MESMILTNETDIYVFFEIIDKVEAESILDVGMFLKRVGSVSRQIKDKEISGDKTLVGVEFFPEVICPIWNRIYNAVYTPDELFKKEHTRKYELATVLRLKDCMSDTEAATMWKWLKKHVSYLLTDWDFMEISKVIDVRNERKITVDDKSYSFITM